jgi:C-terminal processing protease CtpA/Prc
MTVPECADVQPLEGRGVENLEALARLLGYVRFFHPSDGVASANWDAVALAAVAPVETAATPEDLAAALQAIVSPVAPTVHVVAGPPAAAVRPVDAADPAYVVRWIHHGVQVAAPGPYRSERVTDEPGRHEVGLSAIFDAEPIQGRRVRARALGKVEEGQADSASLALAAAAIDHAQTVRTEEPLGEGATDVVIRVPDDAVMASVDIVLKGRAVLMVSDLSVEVEDSDGEWCRLDLPATDLVANPPDDVPLGWHLSMSVPYRVTTVGREGIRIEPVPLPSVHEPLHADLGAGVHAVIPMALGCPEPVPHQALGADRPPTPPEPIGSVEDRSTRLGNVILLWTVFQHFYPYFDVVESDWAGELPRALTAAAVAPDGTAYLNVLRTMVAAIHDGHGGAYHPDFMPTQELPLAWDVVEGSLVVTSVHPDHDVAVGPGDVVVEIDGRAALDVLSEAEALISGSPQWKRGLALRSMRRGEAATVELVVAGERGEGTRRQVTVARVEGDLGKRGVADVRPDPVADLGDGIWYLDLDRLGEPELEEALPRLQKAAGLVVDLRGYPQGSAMRFLPLLTDTPITSAQWRVPVTAWPDRGHVVHDRSAWFLPPARPGLPRRVAFITDGTAISYAESCMGIIEAYGLAAIVGGPTAGANGNNNVFALPGGFRIGWTGMRVLKHDGTTHHNVGIQPTIPTTRTIAGVLAGRDELLDRAVEEVRRP